MGLLLIFASFMACVSNEIAESKDVNQKKIYQFYSVIYNSDESNEYAIIAQFRFGGNSGTTLKLSPPSEVSVNNSKMEYEDNYFKGAFYSTQIKNTNVFNFEFIDLDNTIYKNSFVLNSVETTKIDTLFTEQSQTISWIGTQLTKHETMSITIEGNEDKIISVSTDVIGSNNITLNIDDMKVLVGGNAQYYFTRSYSNSLSQDGEVGGNIAMEYNSSKSPLVIVNNKIENEKVDEQ